MQFEHLIGTDRAMDEIESGGSMKAVLLKICDAICAIIIMALFTAVPMGFAVLFGFRG